MFQCLGLGTVETGGCGEDWWHPECLVGLSRDWNKDSQKITPVGGGDAANDALVEDEEEPLPPGFPQEDDFDHLICFKCIDSNPWIKPYAGTPGFLPPVFKEGGLKKKSVVSEELTVSVTGPEDSESTLTGPKESELNKTDLKESKYKEPMTDPDSSKKRKAVDEEPTEGEPATKRAKDDGSSVKQEQSESLKTEEDSPKQEKDIHAKPFAPKHTELPTSLPTGSFSLFALEDFYGQLCRCEECFPKLVPHPQLREEEDTYEPPLSDDSVGNGAASTGTGSIYDRGEAALNNMDRVRAIEGAMAYNHLRDKLKSFLQPFAESGQAVSADDVKGYFEKLRGDEQGIKDAADHASAVGGDSKDDKNGDKRNEQHGM
jgi:E3 ubiquitin-protein ligase UBR7